MPSVQRSRAIPFIVGQASLLRFNLKELQQELSQEPIEEDYSYFDMLISNLCHDIRPCLFKSYLRSTNSH